MITIKYQKGNRKGELDVVTNNVAHGLIDSGMASVYVPKATKKRQAVRRVYKHRAMRTRR